MEEVPAEEAPKAVEVPTASAIDDLSEKLDTIISKLDEPAADAEEANAEEANAEEAPAKEGDEEANVSPEGEIEIVDDESSEEIVAELMDEIEIVDEETMEEDGAVEETRSASFASKGTGNTNMKKNNMRSNDGHHTPVTSLKENKTHKEANLVELQKENNSLKESLKEYKESFKVLRKQINEVQVFNAKLAYVNKLFSKGGLTNDEKVQIAENFDKTNTVEEAKILYNKIVGENKTISENKTEQLKSKLKSKNPAIINSTKSEALYESKEVSRMKQLAGIKTLND